MKRPVSIFIELPVFHTAKDSSSADIAMVATPAFGPLGSVAQCRLARPPLRSYESWERASGHSGGRPSSRWRRSPGAPDSTRQPSRVSNEEAMRRRSPTSRPSRTRSRFSPWTCSPRVGPTLGCACSRLHASARTAYVRHSRSYAPVNHACVTARRRQARREDPGRPSHRRAATRRNLRKRAADRLVNRDRVPSGALCPAPCRRNSAPSATSRRMAGTSSSPSSAAASRSTCTGTCE